MKPRTFSSLAAHLLVLLAMSSSATIRYVDVNSANPVARYTTWATAATTIQDAVDAAVAGDQILVTNGVYQTGGRVVDALEGITDRVVVTKPIGLKSVNGAGVTLIQGQHVMGCAYLSAGATLVGFSLVGGKGGVWCESASAVVSNCVLTGNSASAGGGAYGGTLYNCTLSSNSVHFVGGGAYKSTLYNCILSGNSTSDYVGGAGAFDCTLNNCIITGNSAFGPGSGAYRCTLNNCIVYYNNSPDYRPIGDQNYADSIFNYSCTTPLPSGGIGNLAKAPLFMDQAGGNLRLQPDSPCINAGSNFSAPKGPDLDGNPRIAGGTVDMGAYEVQLPRSVISYAWLQKFSLPIDGSADNADPDADGLTNWQEWRTGTDPTDSLSALRLLNPSPGPQGLILAWQSVTGLGYFLKRATNLEGPFLPLSTNIVGQPGKTSFTDTNSVGTGRFFYRVGVHD